MFCPKCGIVNLVDQKFCRGCGHALAGHKAALENNFEEAVEKIKSGSAILGVGVIGLIVISLITLAVWIAQNDALVFFTLVPVLAFVIPATILGLVRLSRAYRALSATDRGNLKGNRTIQNDRCSFSCGRHNLPAPSGGAGAGIGD